MAQLKDLIVNGAARITGPLYVGNSSDVKTEIESINSEVSSGKSAVATAITNAGVSTASTATFSTMATNIGTVATNKYNAGVTAADARANTSSTNYKTGYNAGVSDTKATSATLAASGSVTTSGSGSVNPGTNSISNNSATNVSIGTVTTTKPSSGYYVAVDAATAQNTGSISVSGTGTASATVSSAGYATTSLTGSGSVSGSGSASVTVPAKSASTTYVPITTGAISTSGSVTTSGSGSVNPGTNTISSNSATNVSIGTVTTTKPSSGYYVAVDAATAKNTGSISVSGTGTSSATVGTAGYVTSSQNASGSVSGSGSASVTVPAKSASTTYVPITSGSLSSGSGSASASGNITLGTATTTQPTSGYYVSATGSGSVSVGTAGYIAASTSKSSNSATTYYPISTATITNNTSGGTSSGTINAGKQIKIAKGWNNADTYYTSASARGTDKAAATYNTSTSDQTISSGYYLTGTQTIKAVTTANISAANIKKGITITVGDANSSTRIANVTGTYSTISSGQTAVTAAYLLSGYSGFANGGSEVKGSMTNRGAVSVSYSPSSSAQSYTIPAGYHNGSGKVSFSAIKGTEGVTRYTTTTLSTAQYMLNATTIGKYALFAGGYPVSSYSTVTSFDESLTRGTPTALTTGRKSMGATTVGDYALFAGGSYSTLTASPYVDAYNLSLTHSTPTAFASSYIANNPGAATIGGYAIFAGGSSYASSTTTYLSHVYTYNASLTRSTGTSLGTARDGAAGASNKNYAIFVGGENGSYTAVDAYNTSLTHTTLTNLSNNFQGVSSCTVGKYAIFFNGGNNTGYGLTIAYDSYLTCVSGTNTINFSSSSATTLKDLALVGGGNGYQDGAYNYISLIYVYNDSLTYTTSTLSSACGDPSAAAVGDYALFAGGRNSSGSLNIVNAFKKIITA